MKNYALKKYAASSKNWVTTLNSLEMQLKKQVRPQNSNLYAYAANNPVHYIDPDGRVPCHTNPLGWSHDAPQKIFGYHDPYDFLSIFALFFINGTKIMGKDYTIRMWKGTYGLAGAGCEIGIYNSKGRAMKLDQLNEIGLISSTATLTDEKGNELGKQNETEPSFWTSLFKPFCFKKRKNLNAQYVLTFKNEESAEDFMNQIGGKEKEKEAKNYYWNGKNNIHIRQDGNEVIIDYNSRSLDNEK